MSSDTKPSTGQPPVKRYTLVRRGPRKGAVRKIGLVALPAAGRDASAAAPPPRTG